MELAAHMVRLEVMEVSTEAEAMEEAPLVAAMAVMTLEVMEEREVAAALDLVVTTGEVMEEVAGTVVMMAVVMEEGAAAEGVMVVEAGEGVMVVEVCIFLFVSLILSLTRSYSN